MSMNAELSLNLPIEDRLPLSSPTPKYLRHKVDVKASRPAITQDDIRKVKQRLPFLGRFGRKFTEESNFPQLLNINNQPA